MATKNYEFDFGPRSFKVSAEAEGEARYMVRMAETTKGFAGYVRIGYLTGAHRHWLVQHGAGRALLSTPAGSAKAACFALARWALTQPGFAKVQRPAFEGTCTTLQRDYALTTEEVAFGKSQEAATIQNPEWQRQEAARSQRGEA